MLRVSRMAIVLISLIAVGIALIPGITILSLFLFYGTLRSSTFVPTILTLYSDRIPSWGIFTGIALAISVGLPTYLFGELTGNVHAKVAANLGIVLISLAVPLFSLLITRRSNA
jgi:Na+/proline symporter